MCDSARHVSDQPVQACRGSAAGPGALPSRAVLKVRVKRRTTRVNLNVDRLGLILCLDRSTKGSGGVHAPSMKMPRLSAARLSAACALLVLALGASAATPLARAANAGANDAVAAAADPGKKVSAAKRPRRRRGYDTYKMEADGASGVEGASQHPCMRCSW